MNNSMERTKKRAKKPRHICDNCKRNAEESLEITVKIMSVDRPAKCERCGYFDYYYMVDDRIWNLYVPMRYLNKTLCIACLLFYIKKMYK